MIRSSTSLRHPAMTALWIWFALGALALACVPALRGRDPFWGWLPFWLLVAPALDLALLHRVHLGVASRAWLARARRRRRSVQQARRLHTRSLWRRAPRLATVNP